MASGDASKQAEHINMIAEAAAEASTPGASTESQYECPFCVMMRKGGCEDVFKAFMECGEKADKGQMEMADCLPRFEQLHLCMEKNKVVFDGLLQEMKDEEERATAAAGGTEAAATAHSSISDHLGSSSGSAASQAAAVAGSSSSVQQQQQQAATAGSAQQGSSGSGHTQQHRPAAAHGAMATAS